MQKKNDNLIDSLNYNIVSIQINKKRKIARCKSVGFNCEQCNVKCLANKNNPLTIEDLVKARNQARAAAKNVATQVAENKLQEKEQLKAQLAAEAKAKREAAEKAKREAEEKAKREAEEKAKREAEEKAKREAEEKAAAEKAVAEKAAAEKAAAEKAAAEKAAAEKAAAEKAAAEKAAAEKAAAEKAAAEKAAAEKAAAEKAAAEKAAAEKAAAEKAAAEKAAAEKAAAEKAAAEKAAAEKAAAEKAAAEKAAAEKAAAEKAAAEKAAAEKAAAEKAAAEKAQEETVAEKQPAEQAAEPAPEQEKGFKLTLPAYMDEVLPRMATKRARKLIYTPKEVVFETSCKIETAGKKNDEGIKIKNILDAEIKEGLKLGYLEKYDGLKTSEIKEEYENDTVYEIAEQEFKKSGLLADGDKVKLFIYDWTGGGIHHVGYLPDDKAAEVMPFLNDMDKYSFDICSIITGGKSKTIKKDPETGKFTITKNKDGDYGIELDITIINRKD